MLIFVDVSSTNFYGSKAVRICLLVFVLLSRASRVATHLYSRLKPFHRVARENRQKDSQKYSTTNFTFEILSNVTQLLIQ